MKVVFTYNYGDEKIESVKKLGYDVQIISESREIDEELIKDAEILVCYNPFEKLDIDVMKNLKYIILSSTGVDQLPFEKVKRKKILVSNNKGGYSIPIAEWVVLKTLEIYKQSEFFYEQQNKKVWKINTKIKEVFGKNIAIAGTGTIGQNIAKRFSGFDVNIIGLNTKGTLKENFNKIYSVNEKYEFLKQADVLILALPSTKDTNYFLTEKEMSILKNDVLIINIARGSLIKEKDLLKFLKVGKFLAVALDVFEEEPLKIESELWEHERVYISPHNSWVSEMRNKRRWDMIFKNLKNYKNKKDLENLVDLEKGY